MIRLNPHREPRWFDILPGVRVKVSALTTAIMLAARRDPAVQEAGDPAAQELAVGKALARLTILEWEGVGDADGKPVPVTPEAVDQLMDVWDVWTAWVSQVMVTFAGMEAEKNASAPSLNGSSAGAGITAEPAPEPATTAPAA